MKPMSAIVVLACALLGLASAHADGKMFWTERVPPQIPYQRALVLFDEGTQTMVLQSQFQGADGMVRPTVGWVVPVPSVPELASMPADAAHSMFRYMGLVTGPRQTHLGIYGAMAWLIGTAAVTLAALVVGAKPLSERLPRLRVALERSAKIGIGVSVLVIGPVFLCPGLARSESSVDVVSTQQVGVYDVQVIRASDSGGLIEWLNSHSFVFGAEDRAAMDGYLAEGWCFVVARIDPTADTADSKVISGGLAAPLIMRFASPQPVYPLALTGTGGHDTEVLIYLASRHRMQVDGGLALRYAGPWKGDRIVSMLQSATPGGFFPEASFQEKFPYLCKFKGHLSPVQMQKDAQFEEATEDTPFRDHEYAW